MMVRVVLAGLLCFLAGQVCGSDAPNGGRLLSRSGLALPTGERIMDIAFSHDSKLLAMSGLDGQLGLADTTDWKMRTVISLPSGIECMKFSPDDRYLYLADNNKIARVFARFDTQTGRHDKSYGAGRGGIYWMDLTSDGQTLITASFWDDEAIIWETSSGAVKRTFELEPSRFNSGPTMFLSPDSSTLSILEGRQGWKSTRLDSTPSASPEASSSIPRFVSAALSDDGHLLGTLGIWTSVGGRGKVQLFDTTDDYRLVAEAALPKIPDLNPNRTGATALAVSARANRVAVGGCGWICLYSLPEMKVVATYRYLDPANVKAIRSLDFSPDGRWLAMANGEITPLLFDAKTLQEEISCLGHAGPVRDVLFSEDGRHLRSIGYDDTVCNWDAATMAMIKRVKMPFGYHIATVRTWDGEYAVCVQTQKGSASFGESPPMVPAKVVRCEAGEIVSEMVVPDSRWGVQRHWIDEQEVLFATQHELIWFSYKTGAALRTVDVQDNREGIRSIAGSGRLSEDGKLLFVFPSRGKSTTIGGMSIVNTDTGEVTDHEFSESLPAGFCGLVHGGEYLYLAEPGVCILDRKTLSVAVRNPLDYVEIRDVSFSRDGKRYGVLMGESSTKRRTPQFVQVFETLGTSPLATIDVSESSRLIRMSPNGDRVALVKRDNTIELYDVEKAAVESVPANPYDYR